MGRTNRLGFADVFFDATLINPSKISRNILTNTEEAGSQFLESIHKKIERLSAIEAQDITQNISQQSSIDDPIEENCSTLTNSTEDVLTLRKPFEEELMEFEISTDEELLAFNFFKKNEIIDSFPNLKKLRG